SGSQTTCTRPSRSRRSMKITPPWSRRRCAQPRRVTVWPRNRVSVVPQYSVRMFLGQAELFLGLDARRRLCDTHGDDVLERVVDAHVELHRLGTRDDEEETAREC